MLEERTRRGLLKEGLTYVIPTHCLLSQDLPTPREKPFGVPFRDQGTAGSRLSIQVRYRRRVWGPSANGSKDTVLWMFDIHTIPEAQPTVHSNHG
jgi:hypothetical protein